MLIKFPPVLITATALLSGCASISESDAYLCRKGQWLGSSIHVNTKTGLSRFEDVSGDLQKCKDAPICISFPFAFSLATWDENNDYVKTEYSKYRRVSTVRNGASWNFEFSNSGKITMLVVEEPEYNTSTTYVPCGGDLTLHDLVKLGSNVAIYKK